MSNPTTAEAIAADPSVATSPDDLDGVEGAFEGAVEGAVEGAMEMEDNIASMLEVSRPIFSSRGFIWAAAFGKSMPAAAPSHSSKKLTMSSPRPSMVEVDNTSPNIGSQAFCLHTSDREPDA
jgi:hypothetical protein